MRRKWIKWVVGVLMTPVLVFTILMALLYIPPVQNLIRGEAISYASKATGMQINVSRIDLRFPLNLQVEGVEVIQSPDTLLAVGTLNVRVQAWPLFKGRIEADEVTLKQAVVNSATLIDGIRVKGKLGHFVLISNGVDLVHEEAIVNRAELADTHLLLVLNDTVKTPKDSTAAPFRWKIELQRLRLKNSSIQIQLPDDSVQLTTRIGDATMEDVNADFKDQLYSLERFRLSSSSATYDRGKTEPVAGVDFSHIAIRDLRMGIDSLRYGRRDVKAVIREFSLNERSGLCVTSLEGRLQANDTVIRIPDLRLRTPHSEMNLTAQTYWELIHVPTQGRLTARFNAYIGKEDVMLFAGGLPDRFKKAYPFRSLVIRAGTEGNLKQMQISRFSVDLPGAFSVKGEGVLENLTDSVTRSGTIGMELATQDISFLTTLAGVVPSASLVLPNRMNLNARLDMKGPQYKGILRLNEGSGSVLLNAALNSTTEVYTGDLKVKEMNLQHFFPKDSICEVSLTASAKGSGLDVRSYRSSATLRFDLDRMRYGRYDVSNLCLKAGLKGAVASAHLVSDNALLKMIAEGEYHLAHRYPDGKAKMEITHLDLYELGLAPNPLKRPLAFSFSGEVRKDRVFAHLSTGDLRADLTARSGFYPLMKQSTRFAEVLMKQIKERTLNHAQLRETLPSAIFSFSSGKENLLSYYLDTKKISYQDASVKFGSASDQGINGKATVHGLKIDTLQLDTLFLAVKQDTTQIHLHGGVINALDNPQISFKSTLTGIIGDKEAELMAEYQNAEGETGVLLGVNIRPLTEGHGKGNGLIFTLIPQEPVVAFRKFHFNQNNNWIYLHKNMRVYANVDMLDAQGMGIRVHSLPGDTLSLQNIDVEVRRMRLDEISKVLPYFPKISGLFSAEAHYIQTAKDLQISAEMAIDELNYEHQRIGNVNLGATWLPGESGKQYLSTYLAYEGTEIMIADGILMPTKAGKDSIDVNATLEHFPIKIANAFVPDQVVALSGDVDGALHLTGNADQPLINGNLTLDSVSVFSKQFGARFAFDNRPLEIEDNRLVFDKFAIYTTSKNPFTIDGYVDFRELSRPVANLDMLAQNYTLLDAKRTRESLIYGKVLVDFQSTLRGALNELNMRGTMRLLGTTDVSYVMTDSPLTVQDRLGSLVTFTSFSDTTVVNKQEMPNVSLGGLDMSMMIQIDPSVRLKADLSADRSNRVELEGGGDLTLKYTPQGDLTLSGRYTLSGGMMKYELPVIKAKEFQIDNGSYVEWTGDLTDPLLQLKATDVIRSSVSDGDNSSYMVNFHVSVVAKNRLDNLSLAFDVAAPEDGTVQSQLAAMGAEERSKQAVALMITGAYLGTGGSGSGGLNLNMGSALNSVLSGQINSLLGNIKNANVSVGVEDRNDALTGGARTDLSFRYSQRFFNDRFQIVLGGKVPTGGGDTPTNNAELFIDNISFEYRLDGSGMCYVRLFYDKNYESILEGEITEAGVGVVLRKKLDRLSELFVFKRKKKSIVTPDEKKNHE